LTWRAARAEAHAALAAVRWAAGDGGAAEEHFDAALGLDGSWGDMRHVREQTRWPPRLYAAMERFLAISGQGAGRGGAALP